MAQKPKKKSTMWKLAALSAAAKARHMSYGEFTRRMTWEDEARAYEEHEERCRAAEKERLENDG